MALASPTVYVAVDAALIADVSYMAVAVDRGVYSAGDVPDNQRLTDGSSRHGYTEIGSSGEISDGAAVDAFDNDASDGTLTLTVRAVSKYWALVLARHIRRVLHRTQIQTGVFTGDSQWLVVGVVRVIEDFANPDGGHSAVLEYRTSTISTA
jgi:hypothetical protein